MPLHSLAEHLHSTTPTQQEFKGESDKFVVSNYLRSIVLNRLRQVDVGVSATRTGIRLSINGKMYLVLMRIQANLGYFWTNISRDFLLGFVDTADQEKREAVALFVFRSGDNLDSGVLYCALNVPSFLEAMASSNIPDSSKSLSLHKDQKSSQWTAWYEKNAPLTGIDFPMSDLQIGAEELNALVEARKKRLEVMEEEAAEEAKASDAPPDQSEASAQEADSEQDFLSDIFREIQQGLEAKGQVILQGPPGTGKSYAALKYVSDLLGSPGKAGQDTLEEKARFDPENKSKVYPRTVVGDKPELAWALVQFHPSFGYEDFVRGMQSESENGTAIFRAKHRIFSSLCEWAGKDQDGRMAVLIVDEINRADLSRVMGELIFGLELDKRNRPITTPYTVDGSAILRIPRNLSLIGTMNSADRSITRFDFALRRRFAFIDIPPKVEVLEAYYDTLTSWPEKKDDVDSTKVLYQRLLALFHAEDGSWEDRGRECALGPSFLMAPLKAGSLTPHESFRREILRRLEYEVLPQLVEYLAEGVPLNVRAMAKLRTDLEPYFPEALSSFWTKHTHFFNALKRALK